MRPLRSVPTFGLRWILESPFMRRLWMAAAIELWIRDVVEPALEECDDDQGPWVCPAPPGMN